MEGFRGFFEWKVERYQGGTDGLTEEGVESEGQGRVQPKWRGGEGNDRR